MATDAGTAADDGAGRARLRFAVSVAFGFVLGQLLAWPLAFMTPVLAATFLRMPAPLGPREAVGLLAGAAVILLAGVAIVYLVLPYPLLAVVVIVAGLWLTFRLAASGGSALTVVLLLVAILILPLVGQSSPDIANLVAGGFWVNLALAIVLSWLGFAVLPATAPPLSADPKAAPDAQADAEEAATRMTLVVAPIAIAYVALGWSMVLTLLFSALMAQQLSAASGIRATRAILIANMAGAFVAIAAYLLLVAAPSIPFMATLALATALLVSGPVFAGGPSADFWASAFSAFLVILGGSLQPLADGADLKAIDRIVQIGMAGIYIGGAYAILDTLSHDLKRRKYLLDRIGMTLANAGSRVARIARSLPGAEPRLVRAAAFVASARNSARSFLARARASIGRLARPWSKAGDARRTRSPKTDGT